MNDFKEFEHGKECLVKLLDDSKEGQALKNIFNEINPEVFDKVYSNFKNWGALLKMTSKYHAFQNIKTKT